MSPSRFVTGWPRHADHEAAAMADVLVLALPPNAAQAISNETLFQAGRHVSANLTANEQTIGPIGSEAYPKLLRVVAYLSEPLNLTSRDLARDEMLNTRGAKSSTGVFSPELRCGAAGLAPSLQ